MTLKDWKKIPTLKGMIAWEKRFARLNESYKIRIVIIETNDNQIKLRLDKISGIKDTKIDNILHKGFISKKSAIRYAKSYMRNN